MNSNRVYLITLVAILIAFIPALLLRDLSTVYELNYTVVASEALKSHTFFAFDLQGSSALNIAPVYIWLTMLSLTIFGSAAHTFLIFISIIAFLYIIVILDRAYGSEFRHQERLLIMMGTCSLISLDLAAVIGNREMLFTAVVLIVYLKLIKRYELICRQRENDEVGYIKKGNLAIPLLMFLGILINGLYSLLFPLLALIIVLACKRDLKSIFKVFRPYYFLIVLIGIGLWFSSVILEGGVEYLMQFLHALTDRIVVGEAGHNEPFYFYIKLLPLMSISLILTTIYFFIRNLVHKSGYTIKMLSSLALPIAVVLILSVPVTKLQLSLLPALPTLTYFCVLSYKKMQMRDEPEYTLNSNVQAADAVAAVGTTFEQELRNEPKIFHPRYFDKNVPGIEIVGDGYLLGALNLRDDRQSLPPLMTASYVLPLILNVGLFISYFFLFDSMPFMQSTVMGVGFGVYAFLSIIAIILVLSRLFLFSLACTGIGALGLIFFTGLAMPHINPFVGLGSASHMISQAIDLGASNVVCTIEVKGASAMRYYDERFKLKDGSADFNACLTRNANIIMSKEGQQEYPMLAKRMLDNGAQQVGDRLIIVSRNLSNLVPTVIYRQGKEISTQIPRELGLNAADMDDDAPQGGKVETGKNLKLSTVPQGAMLNDDSDTEVFDGTGELQRGEHSDELGDEPNDDEADSDAATGADADQVTTDAQASADSADSAAPAAADKAADAKASDSKASDAKSADGKASDVKAADKKGEKSKASKDGHDKGGHDKAAAAHSVGSQGNIAGMVA